jgi:hypothetical protein
VLSSNNVYQQSTFTKHWAGVGNKKSQTIEQLEKRLKVSLFMARLAKKKEKHPL